MGIKHTPGPWKVEKELTSRTGEWLIAKDAGDRGRWIAIAETVPATGKELANARLLAASPELLEALSDALADFDNWAAHEDNYQHEHLVAWAEKARAAIAKAKGEEQ